MKDLSWNRDWSSGDDRDMPSPRRRSAPTVTGRTAWIAGALTLALGLTACGGSSGPPAPLPPNTVRVANFSFSPKDLTIPLGTTITWDFDQPDAPHNVVTTSGPATVNSGTPQGSGRYTYTFTKAGRYTYDCQVHPYMTGTVVVTP